MNKKILTITWIILFLVSLCNSVKSEENNELNTISKEINNDYQMLAYGTSVFGGGWRKFSKRDKEIYLQGFEDGSLDIIARYVQENDADKITNELPSFYGIDEEELIKKLDNFYANTLNFNIPIPLALIMIRNEFRGLHNDDKTSKIIKFYRKELEEVVAEPPRNIKNE